MENTYQLETVNGIEVQAPELLGRTKEHAVSGDAMLGWMTDEEFDVVADSIVGHFESLAGDLQPKEEKDKDAPVEEVVGWLLKEGVRLMPDSALKYLHNLIVQQLKENNSSETIYSEPAVLTPARRAANNDVY